MISKEQMTHGQQKALRHIHKGKNMFITGGAGTGKSAIIQLAVQEFQRQGKSVIVCAPTGIAAINIGGVTIHAAFGFPSGATINRGGEHSRMSIQTRTPKTISCADVLIIDEISMVRMDLFDSIAASLEKIRKKGKTIQLIVVGDFFQLPPVLSNPSDDYETLKKFYKKEPGKAYAFLGRYWNKCKFYTVVLDEIVRQTDSEFVKALNEARVGNPACINFLNSHCFRPFDKDAPYLYSYRNSAQRQNMRALEALPGTELTIKRKIELEPGYHETDVDNYVLDNIPETVTIKNGALVRLTTNDFAHNKAEDISALIGFERHLPRNTPYFINGTIAHVVDCGYIEESDGYSVIIETDAGRYFSLEAVAYPIYKYVVNQEMGKTEKYLVAKCYQYPITLAWAITIHRSQGQTYEKVNVSPDTFTAGQLYVALSRAKSAEGLRLNRKLQPGDLRVDQTVIDFYQGKFALKAGRPPKNEDGQQLTKTIKVPTQLLKHVKKEIKEHRIISLSKMPVWKPERINVRIQADMEEPLKEQINEWKKVAKDNARDKNQRKKQKPGVPTGK